MANEKYTDVGDGLEVGPSNKNPTQKDITDAEREDMEFQEKLKKENPERYAKIMKDLEESNRKTEEFFKGCEVLSNTGKVKSKTQNYSNKKNSK